MAARATAYRVLFQLWSVADVPDGFTFANRHYFYPSENARSKGPGKFLI